VTGAAQPVEPPAAVQPAAPTAAYHADDRPLTRAAFYALACDPQRSVVVEACAGAGKTWMLVSRILRALLEGAQPHEILAITFTRKAAGEMRERLNEWLREFALPHTPDAARIDALVQRGVPAAQARQLAPELATLHERVLRGGRPVEIRTFHAWFSQLLRAAPLELLDELGLHSDMELIEDLDDHREPVFRRFHAALLREPALLADHAALIAQRGRSQVRKWFEAAWAKRVEFELADAAGVLDDSVPAPAGAIGADGEPVHPAQQLLGPAWQASLRELALALGLGGMRAQDAATGLVMALAQTDAQARFDHAWAALFTEKGTPRKQLGKVAALAPMQDELEVIAAQLRQLDAHVEHRRMARLSRLLLAEFAAYKRTRGLADMSDLERCGLALLRDATLAGWVQERLDARIRHVLIDEFQDTSPLQWHALHAWLSAYAGAGGGASGQRPPGVFIVGDPKQSIYRFRRAEPRVFEAARAFVVDALGGAMLACDHTRRNAPEVLVALNALFAQAGRDAEFSGFRSHTTELGRTPGAGVFTLPRVPRPARAERGSGSPPVWRDSLTTPRHEPEEVLREQEAALVAQAVHALVATAAMRPADIFVLSRKRQSLRLVAQALRRVHVPYAAVEELELMAAPEARDMIALLDALASPRHALSLAQALRSPLFGASDDDLIALAQRAAGGDWWQALVDGELPDSPALQRARALLPRWRDAAARLPPHDLLDRIVHEGQLRERVAATVPAEQRLAALDAIDAVLGQALTLDGARYATPYNFVRALKRRVIKAAAPTHADAVQLLTVHGAKGLEARAVFVMDADPQPQTTETATLLIDWPVEAERPRRCAFLYSEAACPPSLAALLEDEQRARVREELNGLYVSMSRAKERLVFSATEPSWRAPRPAWWDRVAPLASAWPSADAGVADPLALSMPRPASPTPPATLKVLAPLRWSEPAAPDAVAPAAARSPDTAATRLGKAVHRVLEWATAAPTALGVERDVDRDADADVIAATDLADADLDALAHAAATEFDAAAEATAQLARTILRSPTCARFFAGPQLRWAGNEVPVSDAGDVLRVDRLVCLDGSEGPVWWVLDYKLQHAPQQLDAYRDQLLRYRAAVRAAQPGALVRCAFVTGAGALVEID
jgi:ATP-dependent helicase/nuclease subunit A